MSFLKYLSASLLMGPTLFHLAHAVNPLPLSAYHPACTAVTQSRTSGCMAAMHRYCVDNGLGNAGYPQEIGTNEIGLVCLPTFSYADVPYNKIPNCSPDSSQTAACYSSAHRYCESLGQEGVGMIQELGNGVAAVACVPVSHTENVPIDTLRQQHPGCTDPSLAQNTDCIAATHRYCINNNFGPGGAITELGQNQVLVQCFASGVFESPQV